MCRKWLFRCCFSLDRVLFIMCVLLVVCSVRYLSLVLKYSILVMGMCSRWLWLVRVMKLVDLGVVGVLVGWVVCVVVCLVRCRVVWVRVVCRCLCCIGLVR